MVEPSGEYSKMFEFLNLIDKRINVLNDDTAFIERKIAEFEKDKNLKYSKLGGELEIIRSIVAECRSDLRNCIMSMGNLTRDMRTAVKHDDIVQLHAQLEELKFADYLTRTELWKGP